jgi:threonine synthase
MTPNLYIGDERWPTGSFKDCAAVTVAALKEAGVTEMVAASTGNGHLFGVLRRASRFRHEPVPAVKCADRTVGRQLSRSPSFDVAKQVAPISRQRNLYQDRGARTITSIEAMKTIAFEVAEQLTALNGPAPRHNGHEAMWRASRLVCPIHQRWMGPGSAQVIPELRRMGLIDTLPALACIQTDGCAPMVEAFRQGLETAVPVSSPRTHIETLATGDPGRSYTLLRQHVLETNGTFESVSDEEAFRAMHVLAKMEGLSTEPAEAVAFAGLFKLVRSGQIKPNETVVVNCTGHTMPAEEFILGTNWMRDVEVHTRKEVTPQDGLLSALNQVASDRYPKVAIIDDMPEARRLIRRILHRR